MSALHGHAASGEPRNWPQPTARGRHTTINPEDHTGTRPQGPTRPGPGGPGGWGYTGENISYPGIKPDDIVLHSIIWPRETNTRLHQIGIQSPSSKPVHDPGDTYSEHQYVLGAPCRRSGRHHRPDRPTRGYDARYLIYQSITM